MEVQQDAVTEDRDGEGGDIFVSHMVAATCQGTRLRREYDELGSTDTGTVADIFLDEVRGEPATVPRGAYEGDYIARQRLGNGNHPDQLLEVKYLLRACDWLDIGHTGTGGQVHHLD